MEISVSHVFYLVASALLSLVLWLVKRGNSLAKENSDSIGLIKTDIAVIKNTIETVKPDHDKINLLEYKHEKLTGDVNAAHDKIRGITSSH